MRKAKVLYKNEEAGILSQFDNGKFQFRYLDAWFKATEKPAISLTLPKTQQVFEADNLFPIFYNMLPEGSNKQSICYQLRIDNKDFFGLLLAIAHTDTIGAIRIQKIDKA